MSEKEVHAWATSQGTLQAKRRGLGIPQSKGTLRNSLKLEPGTIRSGFQKGHAGCLDEAGLEGRKDGDREMN